MQEQLDSPSENQETPEFYVISLNKFVVLFLGTAGLYMTYWFYKQWQSYKLAHSGKEMPMVRAAFPVFFVSSLFKILTERYEQKSGIKSDVLKTSTTLFIIVTVISFVTSYVPATPEFRPYISLISLATVPLFCWLCYQAQWFVNYACDDLLGEQNKGYTIINYIWLGFGAALWGMYLYFIFSPAPVVG